MKSQGILVVLVCLSGTGMTLNDSATIPLTSEQESSVPQTVANSFSRTFMFYGNHEDHNIQWSKWLKLKLKLKEKAFDCKRILMCNHGAILGIMIGASRSLNTESKIDKVMR